MATRNTTNRWRLVRATAVVLLLGITPWQVSAQSGSTTPPAVSANGPAAGGFGGWLKTVRDEARGKGISESTLDAALRDVSPNARVIELDRRQPEFRQTFWTYLDKRVNSQRIDRGRDRLAAHRDLLKAVQARYGIPPRYIVAFWGLETNFGSTMGGFREIEALATLAYDRRRPGFFRSQLFAALRILEDGHISPDAMTGSWAGAMGHMQFMPSTFIGHAVDYTGDGRKDIWRSLPDAFASAGNYLSDMGWRPGEIWGREVRLPTGFNLTLASMDRKKTLKAWSALGVTRADGRPLPRADMQGAIILPQGRKGPAFLVYANFRVILRWNRSINYALSVGHLADRIVGLPPVINGRDAAHAPLSNAEVKSIQDRLNRLGFDAGSVDGLPGPQTKAALRAFQKTHSLPPDGYPSPSLLDKLKTVMDHREPSTSDARE